MAYLENQRGVKNSETKYINTSSHHVITHYLGHRYIKPTCFCRMRCDKWCLTCRVMSHVICHIRAIYHIIGEPKTIRQKLANKEGSISPNYDIHIRMLHIFWWESPSSYAIPKCDIRASWPLVSVCAYSWHPIQHPGWRFGTLVTVGTLQQKVPKWLPTVLAGLFL